MFTSVSPKKEISVESVTSHVNKPLPWRHGSAPWRAVRVSPSWNPMNLGESCAASGATSAEHTSATTHPIRVPTEEEVEGKDRPCIAFPPADNRGHKIESEQHDN
jgi:hypothetical protein